MMQFGDTMPFAEHRHENGVVYMTAPTIAARHGFTTRFGGVSTGYLDSLNLGSNRGDAPERVFENFDRLGEATGVPVRHMAFTRQVHGAEVRVAGEADVHAFGTPVPYEADGLVTNVPGLALICFTADCVPVLLCDSVHGVIGAVHCGWRSSVQDILAVAVKKMCALGAAPETIGTAVGPAISRCCFEVGGEVIEAAERWLGGDTAGLYEARPEAEGKYLLDLKSANARRLRQLGVPAAQIAVSDECTFCSHDKYWSHRYTMGQRGSQGALIVL